MIECKCIDDRFKPRIVPQSQWVIKGNTYHITHVGRTIGTQIITVTLKEVTLGKECYPYEGYRLDRFAFTEDNLNKLFELMAECAQLNDLILPEPQIIIKEKEEELCHTK